MELELKKDSQEIPAIAINDGGTGKKRVFVVDDSVFIFEEMKYFLKNTNFEIVEYAKEGESAIELYDTIRPDVVTLDIILPGMDGLETAKILFEKWPDAKIVIVSSLAYDDTMEQAKNIGAQEFIFKPFDGEQLVQALTRVTSL